MKVSKLIDILSAMDEDANVCVPDDSGGWQFDISVRESKRTKDQCKEGQEPFSVVSID